MSSGKLRTVGNMRDFVNCQTDVVNKQFVSSLSWNNPLSETWKIYRHLDAKEKHSIDVERIYNMQFHVENNLL